MRDYEQLFQSLLLEELARGCHAEQLLFLDAGITLTESDLAGVWQNLRINYREKGVYSPHRQLPSDAQLYPPLQIIPPIDEEKLAFLSPDITEACLCLGRFYGDELYCQWWGRNALIPVQMWSTTKIIPMLAVLIFADRQAPSSSYLNWRIGNYSIGKIYDRIMDYADHELMTSNALAGMLKQFFSPQEMSAWLMQITGNTNVEFTGLYGEEPFIAQPTLVDAVNNNCLLFPSTNSHQIGRGQNLVSAYDLTRLMSLIGWHFHLPPSAQLPLTNSENLRLLTNSLSRDNGRYLDRLRSKFMDGLVLSKMGFGYSEQRKRTEIAYTCYLKVNELSSLCIGLRGNSSDPDLNLAACAIDARMATVLHQIIDLFNFDD
jgi:hypothetical protein